MSLPGACRCLLSLLLHSPAVWGSILPSSSRRWSMLGEGPGLGIVLELGRLSSEAEVKGEGGLRESSTGRAGHLEVPLEGG